MKKIFVMILILIIIFLLYNFTPVFAPIKEQLEEEKYSQFVSDNGWLTVEQTKIKNSRNEDFSLKGVSSHGIQWYSEILTYDNLKNLKETWGINVFRIAMYTNENGYISNPDAIKQKVIEIANNVIDLDMYVIIDWHTLSDNDPNQYKNEAKIFFEEMSTLYANTPNVIYEICNEPSGNTVTWDEQIKPYAEEIIPIIRANSPNSLIIVGTPNWCKNLDVVADNPLSYSNILYSCHFYAGSHGEDLQKSIDYALSKNLPIFVSEWGTTDASGNGSIYLDESKQWIDFLNERNIGFVNWSFSNKNETSAILSYTYNINTQIDENAQTGTNSAITNLATSTNSSFDTSTQTDFNNYLTDSGKFVKTTISF